MGEQATLIQKSFTLRSSEGYPIHGEVRTLAIEKEQPVVIISHGFRGHKDWSFFPEAAALLAQQGFYTVSFNFSRIAALESEHDEELAAKAATLSQEISDIATITAAVEQRELPFSQLSNPAAIGLVGHSRAGGSSLVFAYEHPELIQALAIWNGGAPPQRVLAEGETLTVRERIIAEDYISHSARFDLKKAFTGLAIPALVVQGGRDRPQLLEQLAYFQQEAPHQHYVFIEAADHTFNAVHPYEGATPQLNEALKATSEFFINKLG